MAKTTAKSRIAPDPIVESVGVDANAPRSRLVSGYIGPSAKPGHWRVYLSLDFGDYLEFAEEDILHVQALSGEGTSGSWVWLRATASVEHIKDQAEEAESSFLRGAILSSYLGNNLLGALGGLAWAGNMGLKKTFSVTECATCPTDDGAHTCVPAVCTLATSCLTTVPTDPGC